MLEGININLRAMEPDDIILFHEWQNNIEFQGRYIPLIQRSKDEMKRRFSELSDDQKRFIIEKKDGTSIGVMLCFMVKPYNLLEIGYSMILAERKKGYCTEAVKVFVDYLFLLQAIERIQATTDHRNKASQRVLEKAGFTKEGIIRKMMFIRGEWIDFSLFSILREEWKEPKIIKF